MRRNTSHDGTVREVVLTRAEWDAYPRDQHLQLHGHPAVITWCPVAETAVTVPARIVEDTSDDAKPLAMLI